MYEDVRSVAMLGEWGRGDGQGETDGDLEMEWNCEVFRYGLDGAGLSS